MSTLFNVDNFWDAYFLLGFHLSLVTIGYMAAKEQFFFSGLSKNLGAIEYICLRLSQILLSLMVITTIRYIPIMFLAYLWFSTSEIDADNTLQ